jgi:muconolactone delta-isomerase
MNKFMVELDLPSPLTADFLGEIPAQHYAVEKLMTAGVIASYTLSQGQSKLWIIMLAETEGEMLRMLNTLPLTAFMTARWFPLAFHNISTFRMPQMILN